MNRSSNWPGFWGVFEGSARGSTNPAGSFVGDTIWSVAKPAIQLRVAKPFASVVNAFQRPHANSGETTVFVTGSLYLGQDPLFGPDTAVTRLELPDAPRQIARLYERYGTDGFAYLDGEFCIVLFDSRSSSLYLVADKCGSQDIFFRQEADQVTFGSHLLYLSSHDEKFDLKATAFYLAHEGFFPAPFTPSARVRTVGRSKFLKITRNPRGTLAIQTGGYWQPSAAGPMESRKDAGNTLHRLLQSAVDVRMTGNSAILLSGGIDSSLLANLGAGRRSVTVTGTVKGWAQGEIEVETSRKLAGLLGLQHQTVILDPQDDSLPDEYANCAISWMTGARLSLPLWQRYATLIRERLGDGYRVIAGQTADTLADNNYTLPSWGYTTRRALYSPWMLRLLPAVSAIAPKSGSAAARVVSHTIAAVGGRRISSMYDSVLDGLLSREHFFGGRVFGYGEFPGWSAGYFPVLNSEGFEAVTDWYSDHFLRRLTSRMTPETFYREMIQLSLDMNMLHLDSRLLFHVYRLEGASAALPFMDARLVNFFGNIAYAARSIFREPKHLVRNQLRRPGMKYLPLPPLEELKSQEQLLLEGSLGAYLREVVGNLTFLNRAPGLLEFVDEGYLESQIKAFVAGKPGVNSKLIAKLCTIEHWSRAMDRLPLEIPESCLETVAV